MKKVIVQPLYNLYRKLLQHSKYRWIVIVGSLLYLISPLDLATDVVPVLGWIDDGVVISVLAAEVTQILSQQLKDRKNKANTADSVVVS